MVKVVPSFGVESMLIVPRSFWTVSRTMSMPTPRPETSVTLSAVDSPCRKTSDITSASLSAAARSAERNPPLTAFRRSCSASRPRPSSRTRSTACVPSW